MSSLRVAMKHSLSESEPLPGGSRKRRRKQEARSKAKRRDTHRRNKQAVARTSTNGDSGIPPPSDGIIAYLDTVPVEEQRKSIAPGHRIKVRADPKGNKPVTWRGGVVTGVGAKGARIRIKFDDGTCEISDFPHKRVFVDMEGNGQHLVSVGIFNPSKENKERNWPQSCSFQGTTTSTVTTEASGDGNVAKKFSPETVHRSQKCESRKETKSQEKHTNPKPPTRKRPRRMAPLSPPSSSDEYEPSSSDEAEPSSSDFSAEEYQSCRESGESSSDEAEPMEDVRKTIAVERKGAEHSASAVQQRKMVQVGHRVKVLFGTKARRNGTVSKMQWYYGEVTHVLPGGTKIRIAYDDGDSEIAKFPDKDIVLVDEKSPAHGSENEQTERKRVQSKHRNPVSRKDTQRNPIKPKSSTHSEQEMERQRRSITVGKKLKVQLSTKSERNGRWRNKWHSGVVMRVMAKGSKICVKFDGDYSEIFNYPDDSIVVLDDENASRRDSGSSASSQSQSSGTQWWNSRRQSRRPDFYFASPWNDEQTEREWEDSVDAAENLSIEEQRAMIAVGQKLKVLFVTELERSGQTIVTRKWYTGRVTEVLSGGSKVRIRYNDGTSEVSDFPDKDIALVGEILVNDDSDSGEKKNADPADLNESERSESGGGQGESENTLDDSIVTESNGKPLKKSHSSQTDATDETCTSEQSEYTTALDGTESLEEASRCGIETQAINTSLVKQGESDLNDGGDLSHEQSVISAREEKSSSKTGNESFGGDDTVASDGQQDQDSLVEEQRRNMIVGQKIKVRFEATSNRNGKEVKVLTWYAAVVTRVIGGGSMIRIQYKDGSSEVIDFPNQDIMVVKGKIAPPNEVWCHMFEFLVEFKNKHGHCNVLQGEGHDPGLASWVSCQRALHTKNQLSLERVRQLDSVGFLWHKQSSSLTMSKKAPVVGTGSMEGVVTVDKSDIPMLQKIALPLKKRKPEILDSCDSSGSDRNPPSHRLALGTKEDQQQKDNDWSEEEEWAAMFQKLVEYKKDNGHCHVPSRYKQDSELANWVRRQRKMKQKNLLSTGKVAQLESLGFAWDARFLKSKRHLRNIDGCPPDSAVSLENVSPSSDVTADTTQLVASEDNAWSVMFDRLEQYKKKHGNFQVPFDYGGDEDLASWVQLQQVEKSNGRLSTVRKRRLESIGLVWNDEQDAWNAKFFRLVRYKEKFGHCFVSQRYKSDLELGKWVGRLRELKKLNRLSNDQVERLESIGFAWDASCWRSHSFRREMTAGCVTESSEALENESPDQKTSSKVKPSNVFTNEPLKDDSETICAFTPEEDELILNIVLGKEMKDSTNDDLGEKMRLLANYSPDELYQRAMELQQQADQAPAVGSVAYRVQSALQQKPASKGGGSAYRAVRIR